MPVMYNRHGRESDNYIIYYKLITNVIFQRIVKKLILYISNEYTHKN